MSAIKLVTPPPAEVEEDYTTVALAALDEARAMIMKADAAGKPCTHVVVCLVAEYTVGEQLRMSTQWVTSALVSDLSALGVLHLVAHDMFGS